jgi:hypothetical protein
VVNELRHRDPVLFWIGVAMLLVFIVVTLLSIGDTRLIGGLNPWIKPMKFLISVTIFVWTVAWFMPETRGLQEQQIVRWTIGIAMIVEIACLLLQTARGIPAHFNQTTPFDTAIFAIMTVFILFNNAAVTLLLTIIRRDPPSNRAGYIWGIRLGLVVFLLATLPGAAMLVANAHTVGAPDGGPGLPFVNWSTQHGDMRVAHFFGIHALQALPLIGFLANSRNLVIATSILWVAAMSCLLLMALRGLPLLEI